MFGRYRVLRELGRGAMGAVFLARDLQLDRDVALKVPSTAAGADADLAERFLREARAAATLRHPHLCPVYDAGEEPGPDGARRLYLTMAYLPGKSLRDAVTGPQPVRAAVRLVGRLADAMAHAHDRGVIHRDLKPANVMLDERGRPHVTDFGLARREAGTDAGVRMTHDGAIIGTPAYMSPEQITGDPEAVGPQTDVYALGVMLYELLTGRLPFDGSVTAVLGKALTEDPVPPSDLRPDVDPALEGIWKGMSARDPAERFESMDAVRGALAEYLKKGSSARLNLPAVVPATRNDSKERSPEAAPLPPRRSSRSSARGKSDSGSPRWLWPAGLAAIGLLTVVLCVGGVTAVLNGLERLGEDVVAEMQSLEPTRVGSDSEDGAGPADDGNEAATRSDAGTPDPGAPDGAPDVDPWLTPGAVVDAAPDAPDWVDLFNGRDLTGWTGDTEDWSVEDGALVGVFPAGRGGNGAAIRSEGQFGDQEARLVHRRTTAGLGGVFLRHSWWDDGKIRVVASVVPGEGGTTCRSVHVSGLGRSGKLFSADEAILARAAAAAATNGELPGWDVVAIRSVGAEYAVAVNGIVIVAAQISGLAEAGPIAVDVGGLKDQASRLEYRSIRVRPLNPAGEPITPPEPDADGWVDLFDGQTLDGWTGDRERWTVRDGLMIGDLPPTDERTSYKLFAPRAFLRDAEVAGGEWEARLAIRTEGPFVSSLRIRNEAGDGKLEAGARFTDRDDQGDRTELGGIYSAGHNRGTGVVGVPAESAAQAADARETNGEPPGWDVVTMQVRGDRLTVAVNGVTTSEKTLPDLAPAGALHLDMGQWAARDQPGRIEIRSFRLRRLSNADEAVDENVETPKPDHAH